MSYEVKFKGRDNHSIVVTTQRGEKIKELVFDGRKDTPLDIDGDMYLIGDIKAIIQVPDPQPPKIPEFRQSSLLQSGPKCRGQFSIQREINQIIRHEHPHPREWGKLIASSTERERVRRELRSMPGVLWCDAKAGECACSKEPANV